MTSGQMPSSAAADCAAEPIRTPGSIQPHGILLVLNDDLVLLHRSANADAILTEGKGSIDQILRAGGDLIRADLECSLPDDGTVTLRTLSIGDACWTVTAHRNDKAVILEFEETAANAGSLDTLYPQIRRSVEQMQATVGLEDLGQVVAAVIRDMTGFDRVLVYRFDEDWNGTVIAEDRNERLPSYLDLRFPAADIPAQARELYRLNRLRLIPDAGYIPVPIEGAGDLDLGFSVLRSVSPVHQEYMRNMGTQSSMSISIVEEGHLWGLIACHSAAPRRVPPHVRNACDFLGQIMAMLIGARVRSTETAERVVRHRIESRILGHMAAEQRFIEGLTLYPEDILSLVDAAGAAVIFGGECQLLGATPTEAQVMRLAEWLDARGHYDMPFHTTNLAGLFPEAAEYTALASGLLAISISQIHTSYVLWFRPEVMKTVKWSGDPKKDIHGGRINPRKSFDLWREQVRDHSLPWSPAVLDTVRSLTNAITGIVLRKAEEMAELTDELRRSNKELEAFSYSVSHDLRAPFRHIVGYAELLKEETADAAPRARRYLDTIIESAFSAGRLVDDLLHFSQMGRATLVPIPVDMNRLVDEVRRMLSQDMQGRNIVWKVSDLPKGHGDPSFLRAVWQNLLSNAIKYTRDRDPACITIRGDTTPESAIWTVQDNGVGFDMAYADKLFGVFQRLHRMEDYEGSGIGLANVRRIVERHNGHVWAEAAPDKGATFHFSLPAGKS